MEAKAGMQELRLQAATWFYEFGYHKSSWYWLLLWAQGEEE